MVQFVVFWRTGASNGIVIGTTENRHSGNFAKFFQKMSNFVRNPDSHDIMGEEERKCGRFHTLTRLEQAMFFPFPVKVRDGRQFEAIPLANSILVALNVLIFCGGWHPAVGRGSNPIGILTYAFGHTDVGHLTFNMLTLLVFGTALNRRIGNGWYMVTYLGSAIALGMFAWLFLNGSMLGASGAIFAVIAMSLVLLPMAIIEVFYFALFPVTILFGLIKPPRQWVFWLIRWDTFEVRAWWGLFLVPLLEFSGLVSHGWNWTNLGHLLGLVCGAVCVLLLPMQISMNRARYA